jgi:hypothetical protein
MEINLIIFVNILIERQKVSGKRQKGKAPDNLSLNIGLNY